jgi:hypothetical protein
MGALVMARGIVHGLVGLFLLLAAGTALAQSDSQHQAWTALLTKHVVLVNDGKASQVRYGDFLKDRAALNVYLSSLSAVSEQDFRSWSKPQQLAFLINAYNAHMVELVLTRYPRIESVWDFGKLLNNPFKKKFFKLFGRDYSLDMIEHDTIRAKGAYDEPRIHFAVNCASTGCPMLRKDAYLAERLDAQLEDQTRRFLSDRTRNRYNPQSNALEVSEIFKWYRADFEAGYRGIRSPAEFFARYAAQLADVPEHQKAVRDGKAEIRYVDYDWKLNDARS